MRYTDILREDANVQEAIKSVVIDTLIPLKAQGITSMPLKKMTDIVVSNDDIIGMDITQGYISQIIGKVNGCVVQTDSDGKKQVDFSEFNKSSDDKKENNKSQSNVDKAATKQAMKDVQ